MLVRCARPGLRRARLPSSHFCTVGDSGPKFPSDFKSNLQAHRTLGVGMMRRLLAYTQVSLIKSRVDPSFDAEEFTEGAAAAYQQVVRCAMEPSTEEPVLQGLQGLLSSDVQQDLGDMVSRGEWLGWGELGGLRVTVHDVHAEIIRASLIFPDGESNYKECTSALFDVRFLTYESLQPSHESEDRDNSEEGEPQFMGQTWRFQGQLLARSGEEMLPNDELSFSIVAIEELQALNS